MALFSMNQHAAIPVDTHVWDIAVRDYSPGLANRKSLTPAVYEEVCVCVHVCVCMFVCACV